MTVYRASPVASPDMPPDTRSIAWRFASAVNFLIRNPGGGSKAEAADYYLFFTGLILMTALLFVVVARYYRGQTHLQEEAAPV